jgi:hypothetical protein
VERLRTSTVPGREVRSEAEQTFGDFTPVARRRYVECGITDVEVMGDLREEILRGGFSRGAGGGGLLNETRRRHDQTTGAHRVAGGDSVNQVHEQRRKPPPGTAGR